MKKISCLTKTYVRPALLGLSALLLAGCTGAERPVERQSLSAASFSADRIQADIIFLADDMLLGRDTGSDGYRIAANYVAAEYRRLGLVPAGANGSYFQEVPFQSAKLNQETASLSATVEGQDMAFVLGDDFLMGASVRTPSGVASGDVVFLGYGIHAPDLGHDDLAGLDLTGKIALVLSGAPQSFQTEIRAHHGSSGTKGAALKARGVIGLLTVNTLTDEKRRPMEKLKKFMDNERFDWVKPDTEDDSGDMGVSATISHDVARKLFAGTGVSFDDVLAKADLGRVEAQPLKATVSMKRDSVLSDTVYSPNVLAVLEGADPVLKHEYVVVSAHLDHIGVSKNAKGEDKINNGALDNAAGIAVMMEVARAYVQSGVKPRRSILFAAVAAEEKGLLGAEYFAHYPTVEKSALVANVNIDMPVLLYDFTDVVAFGADRSSLGPVTAKAVSTIGLTLSPDPMPEEGIFTRSDHYRFVEQGIPSVFLVTGFGKDTAGNDGGKIFMEFLGKAYHSPADQIDQQINYQAGAKFAHVNWLILNAVANAADRPSWNEGDFFGKTFGR